MRLQRVGRKHQPSFRVVLTDSRNSAKSGKFLEVLGSYDPRNKSQLSLNAEKIKYWISVGAQPSGTVNNILLQNKVIKGEKVHVGKHFKPVAEDKIEPKESSEKTPVAAA